MKLGATYNCFSATEHIVDSITRIRKSVDFIVLVVSSNAFYSGSPYELSEHDRHQYNELLKIGLVDHIYFTPAEGISSEMDNRNIGKSILESHGCTHFIFMDEDEMYVPEQFDLAKQYVIDYKPVSSCCVVWDYWKHRTNLCVDAPMYYVPFIQRIDRPIGIYPYRVDSTRGVLCSTSEVRRFPTESLVMHHYSYIRKDIRRKLFSSSSATIMNAQNRENLAEYYDNWEEGMDAWIYPNNMSRIAKVEPV